MASHTTHNNATETDLTDAARRTIYQINRRHDTERTELPENTPINAIAIFEDTNPVFDTPKYCIIQPDGNAIWVQPYGEHCTGCNDNNHGECQHAALAKRVH